MLENAVYSILSPEGFAAILWKDSKRAKEAAKVMKLTAEELKEMGMIEPVSYTHLVSRTWNYGKCSSAGIY